MKIWNEIWDYLKMIIIVVVVVLVINNVVLINAKIPSESMENTIMTGDRIFGYRLAYGLNMDCLLYTSADAQAKAQELVTQHEIMQKAYAQANETINAANKQAQEILDSATQDANSIRLSAITYTDDMMANIGSVLNQTLEDAGGKYKAFIDALQSCLEVVNHNRQELAPQTCLLYTSRCV